ncbi:MAG: pyridoxamine 5'-phosphate oxidase family protein [Micropruina sp.]
MATQFPQLTPKLERFIRDQRMFFVATAGPQGRVNLSPKGLDSLRVLAPHRVAWLNGTGSGNETAAHLLQNPRMTLMFCSFEGPPMILRLYGAARMVRPRDADWSELVALFPALPGARQVFDLTVDLVQTSCGFAVPLFDYVEQRDLLTTWAENRGPEGLATYQRERNATSIDGYPTGVTG